MSKPLLVANRTTAGGQPQLWPHEWEAVARELPAVPGGQAMVALVMEAVRGHRQPVKLRIPMSARQIATVQQAWDRVP